MRPLKSLDEAPTEHNRSIVSLLRAAPPDAVREELERLDAQELDVLRTAARSYAHGALALREGRLDDAIVALERATDEFETADDEEAAALARCEYWLARIRRGPRAVYAEAIEALEALEKKHPDRAVVRVVALHYRGTALRYSAKPAETLAVLLDAFAASDGLLAERAQVLNSLGTLYVVMGAFGAAHAVLEHAAELNHQIGDRVSEAITYGQLGSAALARGELEAARRFLQKQEWFASRVGDNFGQARALTLLGDLAIDLERPDDAIDFAERARERASSVSPPLGMWIAYASRTIGRAKVEIGDEDAVVELERARQSFRKMGNMLGEAFVSWDLAHMHAKGGEREDDAPRRKRWYGVAWALAGLGLSSKVARVLIDLRALATSDEERAAIDMAIAAAAQSDPKLAASQEVELVYSEPATLSRLATRRIAGQRNVSRLVALTLAGRGLFAAAIASNAIGSTTQALPSGRAAAALAGQVPGTAVYVWSADAEATEIARDLSSLRSACGDDTRAALAWLPDGEVILAPFAGEMGARLQGVERVTQLVADAIVAEHGALLRAADVAWDNEASGLAAMSGYAPGVL